VVGSFGVGVVPGSLPNTKAGTRCIQQLSDVSGGAVLSEHRAFTGFLGRTVNVVLKRDSSGEGSLFKQQQRNHDNSPVSGFLIGGSVN
jgi:hypothetical protein